MNTKTTPVMLLRHQAELMAGMALNPGWSLEAEDGPGEALFSAHECERLAAAAPTPYLAGFWFAKALAYREIQALTKRAKG
jgi:hypothetical protein